MRRILLLALLSLLGLVVVAAALGLGWAHWDIRRQAPPLPRGELVAASAPSSGGPVRLRWINTASQDMPRSAVLEPARDPRPEARYRMAFPAFALEWEDGRILLVDAGMTRAAALAFGRWPELLAGAGPMVAHRPVAEVLGAEARRVEGLIFTHLHTDHVEGLDGLCRAGEGSLTIFMTHAQAERLNYTTRPGAKLVSGATCARRALLEEAPLRPVPGFPGVFVVAVAGHTPGSQVVVAFVGQQGYVLVGDVVNHAEAISLDIPKPWLYRLLVVPEDESRQSTLRQYLRQLRDRFGLTPLVSHDQLALEASGVATW